HEAAGDAPQFPIDGTDEVVRSLLLAVADRVEQGGQIIPPVRSHPRAPRILKESGERSVRYFRTPTWGAKDRGHLASLHGGIPGRTRDMGSRSQADQGRRSSRQLPPGSTSGFSDPPIRTESRRTFA